MRNPAYFNRKVISVITPPSNYPISRMEAKNWLKIEESLTDDDALLDECMAMGTMLCEEYTQRKFMTQTLRLTMDAFGNQALNALTDGVYDLPINYGVDYASEVNLTLPLQSVTSVTTYDLNNASSVFSSANYTVDLSGARIFLNIGQLWPVGLRSRHAVEVLYVAGYGNNPADVPEPIRSAIKMMAAAVYYNRGLAEMPNPCKGALNPYKLYDGLAVA